MDRMQLTEIPERARQGVQWRDMLEWLKAKEEEAPETLDFPIMIPLGEQLFAISKSEEEGELFGESIEVAPFFVGWYEKHKRHEPTKTHLVKRGDLSREPICRRKIAKPSKRFQVLPYGEAACRGCRKILRKLDEQS